MTRYFAEIDANDIVLRVVVCDDPDWLTNNLGGTWVETADPYSDEPQDVAYAGPGHGYADNLSQHFAPVWVQPTGAHDAYTDVGTVVWHNGRLWRSTTPNNVWEPGVSGWHDAPESGLPTWVQPTGAHDAYPAGAEVTHNGQNWRNVHGAGNVWEPGVYGWVVF
jgi:hypothetical protein